VATTAAPKPAGDDGAGQAKQEPFDEAVAYRRFISDMAPITATTPLHPFLLAHDKRCRASGGGGDDDDDDASLSSVDVRAPVHMRIALNGDGSQRVALREINACIRMSRPPPLTQWTRPRTPFVASPQHSMMYVGRSHAMVRFRPYVPRPSRDDEPIALAEPIYAEACLAHAMQRTSSNPV